MTETITASATKTVRIGFDRPFCVIGERMSPTGRRNLAAGATTTPSAILHPLHEEEMIAVRGADVMLGVDRDEGRARGEASPARRCLSGPLP